MLIFTNCDIFFYKKMYIFGMRIGNKMKFSPFVALMLFVCGAVIPVLSENTILIVLCFVPFYGYVFFKCFDFSDKIGLNGADSRLFYVVNFLIFLVVSIISLVIGIKFISFALLVNSIVSAILSIVFAAYAVWVSVKSPDLSLLFAEEIAE